MRDKVIGIAGRHAYGLDKSRNRQSQPGGRVAQIGWFENYEPADAAVLGGKNSSLGTLLRAGLPVPAGFAVSADCYRKALADGGLSAEVDALIASVDPGNPAAVAAAGQRARTLIGS